MKLPIVDFSNWAINLNTQFLVIRLFLYTQIGVESINTIPLPSPERINSL